MTSILAFTLLYLSLGVSFASDELPDSWRRTTLVDCISVENSQIRARVTHYAATLDAPGKDITEVIFGSRLFAQDIARWHEVNSTEEVYKGVGMDLTLSRPHVEGGTPAVLKSRIDDLPSENFRCRKLF